MGRTNIVLDDRLLAEAARVTGIETKKELVHEALRTLIKIRSRRPLSELRGKIRFTKGYDYKKLRRNTP